MARDIGPAPLPTPLPRGVSPVPVVNADQVILHIEGERFWVDKDGPHAIQVAQVNGLRGNPDVRLYSAILAPGIPRYGQFHKAHAFLPVTLVEAAYADKGTSGIAIVTITYGFLPAGGAPTYFTNAPSEVTLPQIEILTTVQPATTQFEILPNGTKVQIKVAYLEPPPEGEPGPAATVVQSGRVEYMLPMETRRYMRREFRDPGDKNRLYVGKINSVGIFDDPPHWWMCTRLDGVSDDGGATSNVTYEFQRNPESWNPFVTPTDPATGNPRALTPADQLIPNAARTVRISEAIDFWPLNLLLVPRPR